jgi:hypothetical protein
MNQPTSPRLIKDIKADILIHLKALQPLCHEFYQALDEIAIAHGGALPEDSDHYGLEDQAFDEPFEFVSEYFRRIYATKR